MSDSRLKFFVIIWPLRSCFRQRLILRGRSRVAGKSADWQPVEKCMCNTFVIDIPAADFKLADKFLADALPCVSNMRMRLIGDRHTSAVAELETQRKMSVFRIV